MIPPAEKNHAGIAIGIGSAVVLGMYPGFARLVYEAGGNQILVILFTTCSRALALAGYCLLSRVRLFPNRAILYEAMRGGFFQFLSILGIFSAVRYMPGALVIAVLFSHTVLLLFFLAWKGQLILRPYMWGTTAAALASLTLVLDVWENLSALSIVGLGWALLSTLATVSRLYVYQGQMENRVPAAVGAENFLFAALFTLVLPLFQMPVLPLDPGGYFSLLAAAASLVAGTFGMFYGIAYLGSFKFSLIIKLEPVFTALFGVLIAGERLAGWQIIGIVLLVMSLGSFQFFDVRERKAEQLLQPDILPEGA